MKEKREERGRRSRRGGGEERREAGGGAEKAPWDSLLGLGSRLGRSIAHVLVKRPEGRGCKRRKEKDEKGNKWLQKIKMKNLVPPYLTQR